MEILFVVGAGASFDFDFPVGSKLKQDIISFLSPERATETGLHSAIEYIFGDPAISSMGLLGLQKHCEWMSRTLHLSGSIDSFLDRNSSDGDVTSMLGKIAIAEILGRHESASPLAVDPKSLNWDLLSNTWLGKLWSLRAKGGATNRLENPLPNCSFVTFNYDRCIEQFITLACSQTYRVSYREALNYSKNVPVTHVYGSLGNVFESNGSGGFGYGRHPSFAKELSKGIKTFTEQVETDLMQTVAAQIEKSEIIVFLGFSFAKINQEFLQRCVISGKPPLWKQLFGTALGLSHSNQQKAERWSDNIFGGRGGDTAFSQCSASKFFDDYSLSLA